MSVHTKKHLTKIKIENEEFLLPKKNSKAILSIVRELSHKQNYNDHIPAQEFTKKALGKRPKGAALLRGHRGKENISQIELSKKTGISVPNISAYENGSRKITEAVAKRFAKAFKTDHKKFL